MPLTPFHWSVLIVGFLAFETFYLPALAVSSVVMDLEPLYNMVYGQETLHGFFHTYIGATLIAILVSGFLLKFRKKIDRISSVLKISQEKISGKKIFFSSLIGSWSHIFLDSLMHADMKPFWPFSGLNPFLGVADLFIIYSLTGIAVLAVIFLYLRKAGRIK